MSRLDHDSNEWRCKIVLYGPSIPAATVVAQQLVAALPAKECESLWDSPLGSDPTLVARFKPSASSLVDVQPVYSLYAMRSSDSTATDRQHLLSSVDGIIRIVDAADMDASRLSERELERFLGMFGKMIATMPTVLLASAALDEAQHAVLNPGNQSLFDAASPATIVRALTTLTSLLEEDSGLGGLGLDLDAFGAEDDDSGDADDIEFEEFPDDDEQL